MKRIFSLLLCLVLVLALTPVFASADYSTTSNRGVELEYPAERDFFAKSFPATVQFIIEGAFYGSDNLKSFAVDKDSENFASSDGVLFTKDMGALVAYPAGREESSYTVPDSVNYIASWAFHCAGNLKEIDLPDGLVRIGEEAFFESGITGIELPDSLQEIGTGAFSSCEGLTDVVLPDGVTEVAAKLFFECVNLKSAVLSDDLTGIGMYSFAGCRQLESVNIGSALTDIAENSFTGCDKLTISGEEGSMIQQFAEAMGIAFKAQ